MNNRSKLLDKPYKKLDKENLIFRLLSREGLLNFFIFLVVVLKLEREKNFNIIN